MIRLTILTCDQKLTSSQLNLPHGTQQKRIMKKLKQKNGDAQKKRSGREVSGVSPEAGRESIRNPMTKQRPGHWSGSLLWDSFSALIMLVGWQDGQLTQTGTFCHQLCRNYWTVRFAFWVVAWVGRRKHTFNCIRPVAPMCPHGRAHWRHLMNTTEPSICSGDAVLCWITFDHLFLLIAHVLNTRSDNWYR